MMETKKCQHPYIIKMWPPSQNARLKLVQEITKTLSTPGSLFPERCGCLCQEEVEEVSVLIELSSFISANKRFMKEPNGDGSLAAQRYGVKSGTLMLKILKRNLKNPNPIKTHVPEGVPALPATIFDISRGRGAFIRKEEAENLLMPLSKSMSLYSKICFSNRCFGVDAATIAERNLSSLKRQLTEVDLSGCMAGRSKGEAIKVWKIFSKSLRDCMLRSLDLSHNAFVGDKAVKYFDALLKSQSNLEEFYLMNVDVCEKAAQAISELILTTKKLKILHFDNNFHNNMTGDDGADYIAKVVEGSPELVDFRCSSTRVGEKGGVSLAKALGKCVNVKKIDLRDNMFGVKAVEALSNAVRSHAALTEIYMSYLNLEDEGAIALANVLQYAPSLEVLDMAGNNVTVGAAGALAACIAATQSLTKLNLSENELKNEGTILIARNLENGHEQLKEVDMSTNSMGSVGAIALAKAVFNKPEFKLLTIDGNCISKEGISELTGIFKSSPDLHGPWYLDDDSEDCEGEYDA